MWICCYVSRKYWCKYRGSSWDWTTWKFFMWPMRLWNNFPGQPTSAWMWRYQHSTQPFNTVLLWPMRLQVTSWIIWFVLDISYIWLQIFFWWFDLFYLITNFAFDDLIWLDLTKNIIWLIWFDLIWLQSIFCIIWFDLIGLYFLGTKIWSDLTISQSQQKIFDLIWLGFNL